jgi:hypothetical protein
MTAAAPDVPGRSWQPAFDGLTLRGTGDPGVLEHAALATIEALDLEGMLTQRHALTVQLILELSRSLGQDMARGRITVAMSQATRQLLDAIATLPVPAAAPSDAWTQLEDALHKAET